ncbi:unnamed protein product, partial [Amoebophrya sp. A25]
TTFARSGLCFITTRWSSFTTWSRVLNEVRHPCNALSTSSTYQEVLPILDRISNKRERPIRGFVPHFFPGIAGCTKRKYKLSLRERQRGAYAAVFGSVRQSHPDFCDIQLWS